MSMWSISQYGVFFLYHLKVIWIAKLKEVQKPVWDNHIQNHMSKQLIFEQDIASYEDNMVCFYIKNVYKWFFILKEEPNKD